MADHFDEVISIRIAELETRVNDEAQAVKEHFDEQRRFITESLNNQTQELRLEFRAEISRLDGRIDGLELRFDRLERRFDVIEQRFDRLERRFDVLEQRFDTLERRFGTLERRFGGLEQRFDGLEHRVDGLEHKMDARFDAVHLVLREILDRLPAAG